MLLQVLVFFVLLIVAFILITGHRLFSVGTFLVTAMQVGNTN